MRNVYFFLLGALVLSLNANATTAPACLTKSSQTVAVNNDQVLNWKTSTRDGYTDRAHVTGTLTNVYKDATGHHHWQVTLDANQSGTIEVVYDEQFGPVPTPRTGMSIEACGDYVTASARSHEPSPDGAVIHWIHISDEQSHPSGFVVMDGQICGQQL